VQGKNNILGKSARITFARSLKAQAFFHAPRTTLHDFEVTVPTPEEKVDDPRRYLEPLTLAKVRGLDLQARLVVEGYMSGMHKSPYHGFSVEFAQHREYVPGDDIKHIDWKVYSRTGRFFLKQYEEETNLICWILLDISESMRYGSGPVTK
jgi:uncharacterized protein (DUF58 family)